MVIEMPTDTKARKKKSRKPASRKQPPVTAQEKGKKPEIEKLDKKERMQVLKEFTKDVLKKYGHLIRSIVLFGSTARDEFKGESDIDIFIIIDDKH